MLCVHRTLKHAVTIQFATRQSFVQEPHVISIACAHDVHYDTEGGIDVVERHEKWSALLSSQPEQNNVHCDSAYMRLDQAVGLVASLLVQTPSVQSGVICTGVADMTPTSTWLRFSVRSEMHPAIIGKVWNQSWDRHQCVHELEM